VSCRKDVKDLESCNKFLLPGPVDFIQTTKISCARSFEEHQRGRRGWQGITNFVSIYSKALTNMGALLTKEPLKKVRCWIFSPGIKIS
jgi:hypothetical protein